MNLIRTADQAGILTRACEILADATREVTDQISTGAAQIRDKTCRICDAELNDENWYPSCRKSRQYICKECNNKQRCAIAKANPEKTRANHIKFDRKHGVRPFNENRGCSSFLGIHIAERVLSHVFKDVQVMPMNNPGYDIICNRDKRIDIKSACLQKSGEWYFNINHNTTADYFLCLAFDNLEDLNPIHAWLIPGSKINHRRSTSIRQSTIHKWDAHIMDISKISACCDTIRGDKR